MKDILYIYYYRIAPNGKFYNNRVLVIGFLRIIFRFKLFIYITWKPCITVDY